MICSCKLMIVNLWCHKCFCSTRVRMLWLRISLYSNWIFYGKYPLNLLFCYICKYDFFPSQGATLIDLINKYHVNNLEFLPGAMTWIIYVISWAQYIFFRLFFSTKMNCRLCTCVSSKCINCPNVSIEPLKMMPSTAAWEEEICRP